MSELILLYVVILVMLIGLAGVFLPILPGIELVWLAALGYGIFHGFSWGGVAAFLAITALLLLGLSSDIWITGLGLRAAGTSFLSTLAGFALLVVGSILFTPLVGILLALLGLTLLEYRRRRTWKKAIVSTGTAMAGCGISYGFKFFIGLVMMGVWGLWVLWG
ncbi:MAG: DUF456 domain-containing protein [Anaerolineales bacterium]